MTMYHKLLESGRWFKFSPAEQMANVGSDVERAIRWKKAGNVDYSKNAFERVLELLDLTIADPKNKKRLKEITRVREMFIDYFLYDNTYSFTFEFWQKYFYYFNYIAALKRDR